MFGTFGDIAIFSLRKNLPLIDGGMLRLNNSKYEFISSYKKPRYCYPTEYSQVLRIATRNIGAFAFLRQAAKKLYAANEPPPPLYSENETGFADWPRRDSIDREFSFDYLRPMSRLARSQLSNFTQSDFIEISEKKRYYYGWLVERLSGMAGISVLRPQIENGIVPFCLCCLFDSRRDLFLEALRRKYEVMAWPTLPRVVLERLREFPEVELLGRRMLQIILPADKVRLPYFENYLEHLVRDIAKLLNGISLDNRNR
jgi:hypothetical protein